MPAPAQRPRRGADPAAGRREATTAGIPDAVADAVAGFALSVLENVVEDLRAWNNREAAWATVNEIKRKVYGSVYEPGGNPDVTTYETKKFLSDVDYRAVRFEAPDGETLVAVTKPIGANWDDGVVITNVQPPRVAEALGVTFDAPGTGFRDAR